MAVISAYNNADNIRALYSKLFLAQASHDVDATIRIRTEIAIIEDKNNLARKSVSCK